MPPTLKITPQDMKKIFGPQDGYEQLLDKLFDQEVAFPGSVEELIEYIRNGKACVPLADDTREIVESVIDTLHEREAHVIRSFYGLNCARKTINQIAAERALTPARVRQIKEQALRHLRYPERLRRFMTARWLPYTAEKARYARSWSAQLELHRTELQRALNEWGVCAGKIESIRVILNSEVKPAAQTEIGADCDPRITQLLNTPIADFEISHGYTMMAENALCKAGITHMGDLLQHTQMQILRLPNFGRRSLERLNKLIKELGLEWGMEVEKFGYTPNPK